MVSVIKGTDFYAMPLIRRDFDVSVILAFAEVGA
jgi:hypothetical protein